MSSKSRTRSEFIKFLIVGGISFVVHNVVYMLLLDVVGGSLAYSLGYVSWMAVNFLLSNYVTFKTRPTMRRAVGFVFSSAIYYLLQMCVYALCAWLDVPDIIVTPLVYTITFPLNFLMVRYVLKH